MIHITWPGPEGVVNTAAVPQHTVAAGQKIILTLDGVVVVEAPLEYVIKINTRDKPLLLYAPRREARGDILGSAAVPGGTGSLTSDCDRKECLRLIACELHPVEAGREQSQGQHGDRRPSERD